MQGKRKRGRRSGTGRHCRTNVEDGVQSSALPKVRYLYSWQMLEKGGIITITSTKAEVSG